MKKALSLILSAVLLVSAFACCAMAEELPYSVGKRSSNEFNNDIFVYTSTVAGVKLDDAAAAAYPELADAVNNWVLETFNAAQHAGTVTYKTAVEDSQNAYFYGPYMNTQSASVLRADSSFFSILYNCYAFSGGTHGTPYTITACFDSRTGEKLDLHDVVADMDSFAAIVTSEVDRLYPDLPWADAAIELLSDHAIELPFVIDNTGLTVIFDVYELGSYADGSQVITVPYAGNESLFAMDLSPVHSEWAAALSPTCVYNFDLNGDGVVEQFEMFFYQDNYGMYSTAYIIINDNVLDVNLDVFSVTPVVIHRADGSYMLYLNTVGASDWQSIECISLKAEGAEYLGNVAAGFDSIWDGLMSYTAIPGGTEFNLNTRCTVLGTVGITARHGLSENGMLEKLDELWTVRSAERTAAMTFEAQNNAGESITIPAGTKLVWTATDTQSLCVLQLEDGSEVTVLVDRTSWPYTVSGNDISDVFEGIFFAG